MPVNFKFAFGIMSSKKENELIVINKDFHFFTAEMLQDDLKNTTTMIDLMAGLQKCSEADFIIKDNKKNFYNSEYFYCSGSDFSIYKNMEMKISLNRCIIGDGESNCKNFRLIFDMELEYNIFLDIFI